MDPVHIYTDGSSSGKAGTWGLVAVVEDSQFFDCGKIPVIRGKRLESHEAELFAVFTGVASFFAENPKRNVVCYTDNQYLYLNKRREITDALSRLYGVDVKLFRCHSKNKKAAKKHNRGANDAGRHAVADKLAAFARKKLIK